MRAALLGPLELWEDGRELSVGGGRQQALLAFMVVHRDEVVSLDRLIDALWGDRAPPSAANTVQVLVSRLRKVLPPDTLVTRSSGYALRVDADVDEFVRLVEEARALAPRDAAQVQQRALALWRGRPLEEFAYEAWAQAEISRLDELHLLALEERFDTELELGHHAQAIPELTSLVAAEPLRERLRGQLMLALYRSGRQTEALAVYSQGRRQLVDELGLEPAPELQDLQQRILEHDESLGPIARPRQPSSRRHGLVLLAGGLAAVIAAVSVAFVLSHSGGGASGLAKVTPDSIGEIDPGSGRIVGELPIPGRPFLEAGGPSLWVSDYADRTVSSVDTGKLTVGRVVAPGIGLDAVASSPGPVWALDENRRDLVRISPVYGTTTGRYRLPPPTGPASDEEGIPSAQLAAGPRAAWVVDGSSVVRVNAAAPSSIAQVDVGLPLQGVAVGEGAVWAVSGPTPTLFRIDPRTMKVTDRIPLETKAGPTAPDPLAVAAGEGFVWILNGNPGSVTKVDPSVGGVVATIPLGVESVGSAITVGAGGAWVSEDGNGTVVRIDPSTNDLRATTVGGSPSDVAVAGGHVWVAVPPGLSVNPRRPVATLSLDEATKLGALPATFCSPVDVASGEHPRYLIASDLPLQGITRGNAQTLQLSDAIRFVLAEHDFRAGHYAIGYQLCDDSTAQNGSWTDPTCNRNGRAYAAHARVLGVIGTFNSGCAADEIPILETTRSGPLAMVSPSNTYVGLTHTGAGTARGEPGRYYPRGVRNYARVVADDDKQGAADAMVARELHVRRLYLLTDNEPYGDGIATDVGIAARRLGVHIAGRAVWSYTTHSYAKLARTIAGTGADGVFLGGTIDENGVQLVKDLRAVLGPKAAIIAPDGFTPVMALATDAGPAAEGITVSYAGVPNSQLPAAGRRFVAALQRLLGSPIQPYSVTAAAATEIVLDAIAHSNGTRASVTSQLFRGRVVDTVLGPIRFSANGDIDESEVTVERIHNGQAHLFQVIVPGQKLTSP
jgi:branched-chain amino acid transport system substrate-binding protein